MPEYKKDLIFISHAAPEDNTFTLWLSTRLKLMGFEVWSDVTQLFGGEKWWDTIEQAIDEFTIKFVIVVTKTSLSKPGVVRELELALAAEKKYNLTNFIIPIVIDDSKFGGQPYGLSERNMISFSAGWATGLGKLVERFTRDSVPTGFVPGDLGQKLSDLSNSTLKINQQNDLVLSNRLIILSIPEKLFFYRLPIKTNLWSKTFVGCPFPWFEWGGMFVSYAKVSDLQQYLPRGFRITEAPSLDLQAALKYKPRNHPTFLRGEIFKKMNYLLAESWHRHMRDIGLRRYELSSGRVSWFFPDSEEYRGRLPFADIFGVVRKKQVVGYSQKNKFYWHYAIEPKVQFGMNPKLSLLPHVVFTEDGTTPLDDKNKMHRLRRGFCKNWWNHRWRDLLLGYMELISKGEPQIRILLGSDQSLIFESRPQVIQSRFSLVAKQQVEDTEDEDKFIDVEVNEE